MKILNIHGYKGSSENSACSALKNLGFEVISPEINYDSLAPEKVYENLLIPRSMLRDEDEIFLDDVTVADVEKALNVKISPVINDGYEFIEKILGEELEF